MATNLWSKNLRILRFGPTVRVQKIMKKRAIKGALSWRSCCMLCRTAKIFDKEPLSKLRLFLENQENIKGFLRGGTHHNQF